MSKNSGGSSKNTGDVFEPLDPNYEGASMRELLEDGKLGPDGERKVKSWAKMGSPSALSALQKEN